MRRRLLSCCLCALMLCCMAAAGADGFSDPAAWAFGDVCVEASLQFTAFPPLDAQRLADLNLLVRQMRFRLESGERDGWQLQGLTIRLAEEPLVRLEQWRGETGSVLAVNGGSAYRSAGDAMGLLLGSEAGADLLAGWQGDEAAMLIDAETLLGLLPSSPVGKLKTSAKKLTLEGFGQSASLTSLTVAKADTEAFRQWLISQLPAQGRLSALLQSLRFNGRQQLDLLSSAEGQTLRLVWQGKFVNAEGSPRTLTLHWLRLRTEAQDKDTLTLRSPADKDKDSDTLSITRSLSRGEAGTEQLQLELSYAWRRDSGRGEQRWALDLQAGAEQLSGTAVFRHSDSGDIEEGQRLTLQLALRRAESAYGGTVGFALASGKASETSGEAEIALQPLEVPARPETATAADLDAMDTETLQAARDALLWRTAARLVQSASRLGEEQNLFFSRMLPGWSALVNAPLEIDGWNMDDLNLDDWNATEDTAP